MASHPKPKLDFTIRKLPGFNDVPETTIDALTKVNCAVFHNDRFNRLVLGGHWDLAPAWHRSFVIDCLMGGVVYVVELDNQIIGDALWHGPGQALSQVEGAAEAGWDRYMAALKKKEPGMEEWWSSYFLPKHSEFMNECLQDPAYKLNGWFLQVIGVLPEYQRNGIGSALINVIFNEIARNPDAPPAERNICLEVEAEGARNFYKKLGFVEKGEIAVKGLGDLGCCPISCFAKEF
ncbi:hypothetical protein SCHPADRAFT_727782 [Schizopora paradoxa]|uniref:N-acetyltransferase domain-containing protein n=1 Tax=Schizopora paradoxa TaxID=27342 RepID=A0A0H2R7I2_9AGAM|nr:hypothetical protein SCHPADRAFT_727782 [Schizopora paradoxa]